VTRANVGLWYAPLWCVLFCICPLLRSFRCLAANVGCGCLVAQVGCGCLVAGFACGLRLQQDQARRKKMSRAHDGILKYMLKMMEVCNAQGFVYGIIPEKGKPVGGSSDNLRAWWKDKVRFDRNGPAAIAQYSAEVRGPSGREEGPPVQSDGDTAPRGPPPRTPSRSCQDTTLGSLLSALMQVQPRPAPRVPADPSLRSARLH